MDSSLRIARIITSLSGILGMGLALSYLFAVFLAFQPGFSDLTYLFVGRSDRELPWFALSAAVPYILLLVHLYLRTMLGRWMLTRGLLDDAIAYTSSRLTVSLLRSKTEASFHRLHLAQALIRRMDYAAALNALNGIGHVPARMKHEYQRWKLEACLRLENLKVANEVRLALSPSKDRNCGRAWAAVMELAVRQNDPSLYTTAQTNALWALPEDDARLVFSKTLAAQRWGQPMPAGTADAFLLEVPGARGEWLVARGETNQTLEGDARSKWVAQHHQDSK